MAHGTFSKTKGIVVDIINNGGLDLFEAFLWSDYHEEREYLFIGGLQDFYFLTIHDIAKQRDYKSFIGPISIFQMMIDGYPFNQRPITKKDIKILDRMITDNLSDSESTKIPIYIQRLFQNFTNNVQRMEINMREMDRIGNGQGTRWGYKPMKPLFFADCGTESEYINLPLFLRLFNRSLESIVVFHFKNANNGFNPSIRLDSASLMAGCKAISSNPTLRDRFQSIIIMKPKGSIPDFIAEQQSDFKAMGWKLEQKPYQHPRRGRKACDEVLQLIRCER